MGDEVLPKFVYYGDAFAMQGLHHFLLWTFVLLQVGSFWKLFERAGSPGWTALIPLYNVYVLCGIAGMPQFFALALIIPATGLLAYPPLSNGWVTSALAFYAGMAVLFICLAQTFRRGFGFILGMIMLPFVFVPLLAFGSDDYAGPSARIRRVEYR